MLNLYKKSILALLEMLHAARIRPYDNVGKWLLIQETLVRRIIYVENRIRISKNKVTELNKQRKNPQARLSKEESIETKNLINYLQDSIEEYGFILSIYKSIGDGIAFTFLDKLDVKPQNFKESPGFISNKYGLRQEMRYLRYALKNGMVAILHDITSVLKYADLTLMTPAGPILVEAKSSFNKNPRLQRQEDKTNQLVDYLKNDTTYDLYNNGAGEMHRMALSGKQVDYAKEFNALLTRSYYNKKKFAFTKVEEGVVYCVAHPGFDGDKIPNVASKMRLENPFMFMLNDFKFIQQGYYPFSLLFHNPEHYWRFLQGEFVVMVLIDYATIEKIAISNGYNVQRSEMAQMLFRFDSIAQGADATAFLISEHYFFRSFMEFVSVNGLITEACGIWNKVIQSPPRAAIDTDRQ